MTAPVYVPSKGRATTATTPRLVACTLVVEPQDADVYRAHFENVLVLPENDQGLAYARNYILSLNTAPFWMMDDDITGFYQRLNKRMQRIDGAVAIAQAECLFASKPHIAQGALEYQQFAWSTTHDYTLNGYCDVCVWINPVYASKVASYHADLVPKEDRDFTLQILTAGYRTMRVQAFAFSAPKNGSNAGGLKPVYDTTGAERAGVDRLCAKYPGLVTPQTKPDGRYDAKINWRAFKTPPLN